jgi:hypothetical protein
LPSSFESCFTKDKEKGNNMAGNGDARRHQEGDQRQSSSQDKKKPNAWLHPEQTEISGKEQLAPRTDTPSSRITEGLTYLFDRVGLNTPEVTKKLNEFEETEGAGDRKTAPKNALSLEERKKAQDRRSSPASLFEGHIRKAGTSLSTSLERPLRNIFLP